MRKTPADHARMLLKKAADDLTVARMILDAGSPLDMAGFHAQQAAEKSLKAILAFHDVDYPKTHAIGELIGHVKPLVTDWPFDEERLDDLTRYAVGVRYDDRYTEADLAEAREAFATAKSIRSYAETMIGPADRASEESTGG